ncbi:MAG: FtsX-like permease family protein [Verrucomicrobiota bacterium]|nr:FtsX-like permease family protein [Verrucomicrobiota bacterium]
MTAQHFRIYRWQVLRYVAQHRLLALLNVLSVALGVAVFFATQIANQSANRAFAASVDVVAGKADLEVTAPGIGVAETALPIVSAQRGITGATPLVRGVITLPDFPGEYLEILGVDLFTDEGFRTFDVADSAAGKFDLEDWLGRPDSLAISDHLARKRNLKRGDTLRVQVNGVERRVRVASIWKSEGSGAGDEHFAAMDIGWAQELFGMRGRLSAIELRIDKSSTRTDIAAHLRKLLPPDTVVAAPARRSEQVDKMLGGFELNLTAMSLVSVLVGMFLIYNAVSASVVRRRREIGILRSLGVTRNEIRLLVLGEALAGGVLGTALGLVGGLLLAQFLVGVVAGTISSLYVLVSVTDLAVRPIAFAGAAVVGIVSVVVAAWVPAQAASRMEPVRALGGGTSIDAARHLSSAWWYAGLGAIVFAVALSVLALTTGPAWLGFGAAFFVLAGFSLIVPPATFSFSRAVANVFQFWRGRGGRASVEASLANANLSRALARNSVTIASLAAAVAMTVGVSVMVFSFRQTVEGWINQTLLADLFIAPASNELIGPSSFIPPECVSFLATNPAVATVDTFREIEIPFGAASITLAVVRGSERRRLQFVRGDGAEIMRRFYAEECVLVSESFARRHHVHDGGSLELRTPAGPRRFRIAGTFYDYTRDQGVVYMSRDHFVHLWQDDRINSLAVYLRDGASPEQVTADFRARFSDRGQFAVYSNRTLRTRIFEIFDQTFAVTYVLRTIAVVVALVGIFLSLTTLIIERARDLAVLRAIGASAGQIRRLLLWESAMIGLLAAVIGVVSGVCLSTVLTGVINRAFFGWTIRLAFPWTSLATTPLWIIAAAIVAGLLPAWRAARMELAEALRNE